MNKGRQIIMVAVLLFFCGMCSQKVRAASVKINDKNFPDIYFKAYVEATVDKNQDGRLSDKERAAVKELDLGETSEYRLEYEYLPVESLKGIEYFPNLVTLDCSSSMLSSLNVTRNRKLKTLRCNANSLTKLNVSKNKKLTLLNCRDNQQTDEAQCVKEQEADKIICVW